MSHTNFEFKAAVKELVSYENKLKELNPIFKGIDYQKDTYFNVEKGRLKLREGNIENALIWYDRANTATSKESSIILYPHQPDSALKDILIKIHGIKVIVNKVRRIYFIENVKFHFDEIQSLGTFIEVEAIDSIGEIPIGVLKEQCEYYADFFGLKDSDFIAHSYSDLLMK